MNLLKKYKEGKLTAGDVRHFNNSVIVLLVLIVGTSIVWSVSIQILSADFYHGVIGTKLEFETRDFSQMNDKAKKIFYNDLEKLLNETYMDPAMAEARASGGIWQDNSSPTREREQSAEHHVTHLRGVKSRNVVPVDEQPDGLVQLPSSTLPPPAPSSSSSMMLPSLPVKVRIDVEEDRKFLATMTIAVHEFQWREKVAIQFMYSFPFLSEIISIVWAAMCLVFQTDTKAYWGLPQPWRIVVPSIFTFSMMLLSTVAYTLLADHYLDDFCTGLRSNLSSPDVISCGQAIVMLRSTIRRHELSLALYLNLFRVSYWSTMVLWSVVLLLMVLRFALAIDFQIIDVHLTMAPDQPAISVDALEQQPLTQLLPDSLRRHEEYLTDALHKSEDDFQSAKSQLSDQSTPLLYVEPRRLAI